MNGWSPATRIHPGIFCGRDHKNGYIDIVEKVSIKILKKYYGIMPGNKVPYMHQHKAIFKDVEQMLAEEFPGVPMSWALSMYPGNDRGGCG